MEQSLKQLVEITQFYGGNKEFVIAGGGNTSYKDDKYLWVKASGADLDTITEEGFAQLYRSKIRDIADNEYSGSTIEREKEVGYDLLAANVKKVCRKKPSVEAGLHELIDYKFVVHTHPAIINGILCSRHAKQICEDLFGKDALFVEYTDPGFALFKKVGLAITAFKDQHDEAPKVILLENHGVFVGADTTEEIQTLYDELIAKAKSKLVDIQSSCKEINPIITKIVPAIKSILAGKGIKIAKIRNNELLEKFLQSKNKFEKVAVPLIPDVISYCNAGFMYFDAVENPESFIDQEFMPRLNDYRAKHDANPKIIAINGIGVIGVGQSSKNVQDTLDVFQDQLKIAAYAEQIGGIKCLTDQEMAFVIERDRPSTISSCCKTPKKQGQCHSEADCCCASGQVSNKTAIVTGGAQGFGEGIVRKFFDDGVNVVIADLNTEKGIALQEELNACATKNKALFVQVDVSDFDSLQNLMLKTVRNFGGLDVFVSNAGILRAGGVEELEPSAFELMTKVNYSAYFLCTKAAAPIMKLQNKYNEEASADIIQVNSKSGLKGSNKNFAYAGGKFGGLGLTQSFALELMPSRIKVNSICPGNFFDGPLWSDPDNGLFVQYLEAGKVPGAKSIEDVKKFYEAQVPANRGCTSEDVMKAIYYVMDQQYETGQAVPVTGGQIMLN